MPIDRHHAEREQVAKAAAERDSRKKKTKMKMKKKKTKEVERDRSQQGSSSIIPNPNPNPNPRKRALSLSPVPHTSNVDISRNAPTNGEYNMQLRSGFTLSQPATNPPKATRKRRRLNRKGIASGSAQADGQQHEIEEPSQVAPAPQDHQSSNNANMSEDSTKPPIGGGGHQQAVPDTERLVGQPVPAQEPMETPMSPPYGVRTESIKAGKRRQQHSGESELEQVDPSSESGSGVSCSRPADQGSNDGFPSHSEVLAKISELDEGQNRERLRQHTSSLGRLSSDTGFLVGQSSHASSGEASSPISHLPQAQTQASNGAVDPAVQPSKVQIVNQHFVYPVETLTRRQLKNQKLQAKRDARLSDVMASNMHSYDPSADFAHENRTSRSKSDGQVTGQSEYPPRSDASQVLSSGNSVTRRVTAKRRRGNSPVLSQSDTRPNKKRILSPERGLSQGQQKRRRRRRRRKYRGGEEEEEEEREERIEKELEEKTQKLWVVVPTAGESLASTSGSQQNSTPRLDVPSVGGEAVLSAPMDSNTEPADGVGGSLPEPDSAPTETTMNSQIHSTRSSRDQHLPRKSNPATPTSPSSIPFATRHLECLDLVVGSPDVVLDALPARNKPQASPNADQGGAAGLPGVESEDQSSNDLSTPGQFDDQHTSPAMISFASGAFEASASAPGALDSTHDLPTPNLSSFIPTSIPIAAPPAGSHIEPTTLSPWELPNVDGTNSEQTIFESESQEQTSLAVIPFSGNRTETSTSKTNTPSFSSSIPIAALPTSLDVREPNPEQLSFEPSNHEQTSRGTEASTPMTGPLYGTDPLGEKLSQFPRVTTSLALIPFSENENETPSDGNRGALVTGIASSAHSYAVLPATSRVETAPPSRELPNVRRLSLESHRPLPQPLGFPTVNRSSDPASSRQVSSELDTLSPSILSSRNQVAVRDPRSVLSPNTSSSALLISTPPPSSDVGIAPHSHNPPLLQQSSHPFQQTEFTFTNERAAGSFDYARRRQGSLPASRPFNFDSSGNRRAGPSEASRLPVGIGQNTLPSYPRDGRDTNTPTHFGTTIFGAEAPDPHPAESRLFPFRSSNPFTPNERVHHHSQTLDSLDFRYPPRPTLPARPISNYSDVQSTRGTMFAAASPDQYSGGLTQWNRSSNTRLSPAQPAPFPSHRLDFTVIDRSPHTVGMHGHFMPYRPLADLMYTLPYARLGSPSQNPLSRGQRPRSHLWSPGFFHTPSARENQPSDSRISLATMRPSPVVPLPSREDVSPQATAYSPAASLHTHQYSQGFVAGSPPSSSISLPIPSQHQREGQLRQPTPTSSSPQDSLPQASAHLATSSPPQAIHRSSPTPVSVRPFYPSNTIPRPSSSQVHRDLQYTTPLPHPAVHPPYSNRRRTSSPAASRPPPSNITPRLSSSQDRRNLRHVAPRSSTTHSRPFRSSRSLPKISRGATKVLLCCTLKLARQIWGAQPGSDEYDAAIAAGVIVHESHTELWKDPPSANVINEYEEELRRSTGPIAPIATEHLIPNWNVGSGSPWNATVIDLLARDLHDSITNGDWDEAIPGLDRYHRDSHSAWLASKLEDRFHRFKVEYQEQRPITLENEEERQVAIRTRAAEITARVDIKCKRSRHDSRKLTLAKDRYRAIPNIEERTEREALQMLFQGAVIVNEEEEEVGIGGNEDHEDFSGELSDSSNQQRQRTVPQSAKSLMSDDETDTEASRISRKYIMVPPLWRDQKISTALRFLDNRIPGTRPVRAPGAIARERAPGPHGSGLVNTQQSNARTLLSGIPRGLPENYYDHRWISSLPTRIREQLRTKSAVVWDPANVFR